MEQNKHVDSVMQAYRSGQLNDYMRQRLIQINHSGVTDSLLNELIEDAKLASNYGVNNDKDYNAYFFIGHIVDDILDETFNTKLDDSEKNSLKKYLFENKKELNNLTDYRVLVHKWLCSALSKTAHPNIAGKEDREPICDVDKWIATLRNIYGVVHSKQATHSEALDYFTSTWDVDEKQKFINWMKYYENKTTEKYNVKNAQFKKDAAPVELPLRFADFVPEEWLNKNDRQNTTPYLSSYKVDQQRTQRELDADQAKILKIKMRGRIYSFRKLLDKLSDLLPEQNLTKIYEELNKLDYNMSIVKVLASVQDCIIRSANRIRKFGFVEGAEILEKTAAESAVGQNVMNSMPRGISDQPNLSPSQTQTFNVKTIIDRLEGLSKTLKTRDMIRELASVDILLNEIGLASYFPELTDAQGKLIEAYGYASNKVESAIAKLRGSGTSKPKPAEVKPPTAKPPTAPMPQAEPIQPPQKPMETGEMMDKPIGDVKTELPIAEPKKQVPVTPKKPG